jgi:hypothetical protein
MHAMLAMLAMFAMLSMLALVQHTSRAVCRVYVGHVISEENIVPVGIGETKNK